MSYPTNYQPGCIMPVYKFGCGSKTVSSGLLSLALCIPLLAFAAEKQTSSPVVYEIAINNGRVIDPESGLDAQRNIGIRNGRIATITGKKITAQRTIDAEGMIVAPGFIDTHVHAPDLPLNQRMLARDGVTTALDLENGAYPFTRWYARLEGNSYINFGASVSSIAVREALANPAYDSITGSSAIDLFKDAERSNLSRAWVDTRFSDAQLDELKRMLISEIEQGALGVGLSLAYHASGTTSREANIYQEAAAETGALVAVHGRYFGDRPPHTGLVGLEEYIAKAFTIGGGLLLVHLPSNALQDTGPALQTYLKARQRGLSILAEVSPYSFATTMLQAEFLQPDAFESSTGLDISNVSLAATGEPLTREKYSEAMASNPGQPVIVNLGNEEAVRTALTFPYVVVASDALVYQERGTGQLVEHFDANLDELSGHPRTTGAHAKVLRLTREENLMSWPEVLAKLSLYQALFLQENGVPQMRCKGRIQQGMDADITIFDPETVRDNATLETPAQPSTGIPYVLVNGEMVVENSTVLKTVNAGTGIKHVNVTQALPHDTQESLDCKGLETP